MISSLLEIAEKLNKNQLQVLIICLAVLAVTEWSLYVSSMSAMKNLEISVTKNSVALGILVSNIEGLEDDVNEHNKYHLNHGGTASASEACYTPIVQKSMPEIIKVGNET